MATTTKTGRLFESAISIEEKGRQELVALLNRALATNLDLWSQSKQAHWNVKGTEFYQLHLLFDEIAGLIEGFTDRFAERITALGGEALGTVRMAGSASLIAEFPAGTFEGRAYLEALRERYAEYGRALREDARRADEEFDDLTTNDLLIEATHAADQALYFLEAHLQQKR